MPTGVVIVMMSIMIYEYCNETWRVWSRVNIASDCQSDPIQAKTSWWEQSLFWRWRLIVGLNIRSALLGIPVSSAPPYVGQVGGLKIGEPRLLASIARVARANPGCTVVVPMYPMRLSPRRCAQTVGMCSFQKLTSVSGFVDNCRARRIVSN